MSEKMLAKRHERTFFEHSAVHRIAQVAKLDFVFILTHFFSIFYDLTNWASLVTAD